MRARRPGTTTDPTPTARRLRLAFAALALALVMVPAGAGAALAGTAPTGRQEGTVQRGTPAATAPETRDGSSDPAPAGSSPAVPLLFAGIVILAAAGPWVPPGPRYLVYRIDRRW
jgi:hypothetical protein